MPFIQPFQRLLQNIFNAPHRSIFQQSARFSANLQTPTEKLMSLEESTKATSAPKILGHNIITEENLSSVVDDRLYYELPILHLLAKRNNLFATLTDCNGRILCKSSCGAEGFQNARKKTTVAAQTLGISMGLKARKLGINSVRIIFRGLGHNRLSSLSGLNIAGLKIISLTDDTNVHYGHGRRPRRPPRK